MNATATARDISDLLQASPDVQVWISGRGTRIVPPVDMMTVRAPIGIRAFSPEEMTVRCGAGTSVDELLVELAGRGQYANVPHRKAGSGTVGGALAVAEGDVLRLGRGSVRDVLLQAEFVDGRGTIIRAGGPTVKNVSGFDLCRLLVGSCGRVGFLTEVVLRTRPLPSATRWFRILDAERADITCIMDLVHKPSSVLWSGPEILLCIEGHPDDLEETRRHLEGRLGKSVAVVEPPDLSGFPHRRMVSPRDIDEHIFDSPGQCVAEIGTGVVHHARPATPIEHASAAVIDIEQRLLEQFDPADRLNGGSRIWGSKHMRTPMVHT